jgi:undecaprenyl-diphosphatase
VLGLGSATRSSSPRLATVVESFDEAVDDAFAPLRGKRLPDAVAAAASSLGDRGLIWFLIGLLRARRPGVHRTVALRAVVFTGTLSPIINATLKAAVGRARPEMRAFHHVLVRVPRTASFPSGHTMAAWCAATLLADRDPFAPLYYTTASVISLSRIHVRLHHATDVVGGALIGIGLGHLGRRLFRAFPNR